MSDQSFNGRVLARIADDVLAAGNEFLVSANADKLRIGSRVLRAMIQGRFWKQTRFEWDQLREQGKIGDDRAESEEVRDCLFAMTHAIEDPDVNEHRADAIRAIFLSVAQRDDSSPGEYLSAELLNIARGLQRVDLLILRDQYDAEPDEGQGSVDLRKWASEVALRTGLVHPEIVLNADAVLQGKGLLKVAHDRPGMGVRYGDRGRLTGLGIALCESMTQQR